MTLLPMLRFVIIIAYFLLLMKSKIVLFLLAYFILNRLYFLILFDKASTYS